MDVNTHPSCSRNVDHTRSSGATHARMLSWPRVTAQATHVSLASSARILPDPPDITMVSGSSPELWDSDGIWWQHMPQPSEEMPDSVGHRLRHGLTWIDFTMTLGGWADSSYLPVAHVSSSISVHSVQLLGFCFSPISPSYTPTLPSPHDTFSHCSGAYYRAYDRHLSIFLF